MPSEGYELSGLCDRTVGTDCAYACAAGYEQTKTLVSKCLSTGQWESVSGCQQSTGYCPMYWPPTGYELGSCDGTGTSISDTCTLTCSYGYGSTPGTVTCLEGKIWSAATGCTKLDQYCDPAIGSSTGYNSAGCLSVRLGDSCARTCALGYEGTPSPSECVAVNEIMGSWTASAGCFNIDDYCSSSLTAVVGYEASYCTSMKIGDTCEISCANGYTGEPDPVICSVNVTAHGKWSERNGCDIMPNYCSNTTDYTVGYVNDLCLHRTIGSNCPIQCDLGFTGAPSPIVCMDDPVTGDGVWYGLILV